MTKINPTPINDKIEWKHYEDYAISIDGDIISLTGNGVQVTDQGYYRFRNGTKNTYLHKAVWLLFGSAIPEKMCVMHIDGNKANNALVNLALTTKSGSAKLHALSGRTHQIKNIKQINANRIKKLLVEGVKSYNEISESCKCSKQYVYKLAHKLGIYIKQPTKKEIKVKQENILTKLITNYFNDTNETK